jgi:alkanesulfonate monooxygenase SsuD/methylene tetrahydromethanopterin reductase-like flavin-dependent oxidoreductase (luciferase family)
LSSFYKQIGFGWVLPTGKARMPNGGSQAYLPHLRDLVATIQGSFHSLWMPDHLMFGQSDIPEALTSLSFLAGITTDLHLGTIVLGQSYRNPALLAKMAATLQQLSDGRFILGIGAGWKEDEYHAYGYEYPPARTRIAQMAETIQICKALWDPAQPQANFQGEHYQISNAACSPKPVSPPPIMIGGSGEKLTLRVVAEHADWWNIPGVSPTEYARKLDILANHCAAVGRDPNDIRKTWTGVVSIAPTRSQAERQMEGYPIWPDDIPLVGTPDGVRAQLQAYIDLGVDYFMLAFADEPSTKGIKLFLSEFLYCS